MNSFNVILYKSLTFKPKDAIAFNERGLFFMIKDIIYIKIYLITF